MGLKNLNWAALEVLKLQPLVIMALKCLHLLEESVVMEVIPPRVEQAGAKIFSKGTYYYSSENKNIFIYIYISKEDSIQI